MMDCAVLVDEKACGKPSFIQVTTTDALGMWQLGGICYECWGKAFGSPSFSAGSIIEEPLVFIPTPFYTEGPMITTYPGMTQVFTQEPELRVIKYEAPGHGLNVQEFIRECERIHEANGRGPLPVCRAIIETRGEAGEPLTIYDMDE